MAKLSLKSNMFLIHFFYFFRNLFFHQLMSSVSTVQSKGTSHMAEAARAIVELRNPANQFLLFVIRQLQKRICQELIQNFIK